MLCLTGPARLLSSDQHLPLTPARLWIGKSLKGKTVTECLCPLIFMVLDPQVLDFLNVFIQATSYSQQKNNSSLKATLSSLKVEASTLLSSCVFEKNN